MFAHARTAWFKKNGSTFHGYAQSPSFKGVLGILHARGRFTMLSQRLSEKWYDFFTATAVSYSGTANTATATAIPRAGTAISRTYSMRERLVKRSWNVGNAPARPRPLYLQGF